MKLLMTEMLLMSRLPLDQDGEHTEVLGWWPKGPLCFFRTLALAALGCL